MALTRLGPNQAVNLSTNVTGTLATGNGGTGATSFSPGKILQVVSSTLSSEATTNSTSMSDTGLTVTITPSATGSKVLVIVNHTGLLKEASDNAGEIELGATIGSGSYATVRKIDSNISRNGSTALNVVGGTGTSCLHSPSTTSAVVYKTRFRCDITAANNFRVQQNNCVASITAMEIGA